MYICSSLLVLCSNSARLYLAHIDEYLLEIDHNGLGRLRYALDPGCRIHHPVSWSGVGMPTPGKGRLEWVEWVGGGDLFSFSIGLRIMWPTGNSMGKHIPQIQACI